MDQLGQVVRRIYWPVQVVNRKSHIVNCSGFHWLKIKANPKKTAGMIVFKGFYIAGHHQTLGFNGFVLLFSKPSFPDFFIGIIDRKEVFPVALFCIFYVLRQCCFRPSPAFGAPRTTSASRVPHPCATPAPTAPIPRSRKEAGRDMVPPGRPTPSASRLSCLLTFQYVKEPPAASLSTINFQLSTRILSHFLKI